jgi:hypothetical protein
MFLAARRRSFGVAEVSFALIILVDTRCKFLGSNPRLFDSPLQVMLAALWVHPKWVGTQLIEDARKFEGRRKAQGSALLHDRRCVSMARWR